MIFKKQPPLEEVPAFSNRELYEFIYGKKPSRKKNKAWRKIKRMFRSNEVWAGSKSWNIAGAFSLFLTVIPFLLLWESVGALRQNLVPLQFGAAAFFCLFIFSRGNRESLIFKVSGILAIFLATLIPVLVLILYLSWYTVALVLPAQMAICGIAAIYRSDENLEVIYVIYKAFSYLVFTFFIGWLGFYAITNV